MLAQDSEGAGRVAENDRLLARGLDRALGPFNCAIPLADRGEIDRARPQRPAVLGIHLQVPLDVGPGGFQGLARCAAATPAEISVPLATRRPRAPRIVLTRQ